MRGDVSRIRPVLLSQRVYEKQTAGPAEASHIEGVGKKRLRKIVRDAILSPRPKCEFKDYARLLKNIGTPEFRQVIRNLPVPDVPYLSARRSCCLREVYWKSS